MFARTPLSDVDQPAILECRNPGAALAATRHCPHCGTRLERTHVADARTVLDRPSWDQRAGDLLEASAHCCDPVTLLFLDLDRFKDINDTFGHVAGNRVLDAVADVLLNGTRHDDLLGRYGGDEFLVLMVGTDLPNALPVANRIHDAIGSLQLTVPALGGTTAIVTTVTASIGVARYSPGHHHTLDDLVCEADSAMYAAKYAGRNQVYPAPLRPRPTL